MADRGRQVVEAAGVVGGTVVATPPTMIRPPSFGSPTRPRVAGPTPKQPPKMADLAAALAKAGIRSEAEDGLAELQVSKDLQDTAAQIARENSVVVARDAYLADMRPMQERPARRQETASVIDPLAPPTDANEEVEEVERSRRAFLAGPVGPALLRALKNGQADPSAASTEAGRSSLFSMDMGTQSGHTSRVPTVDFLQMAALFNQVAQGSAAGAPADSSHGQGPRSQTPPNTGTMPPQHRLPSSNFSSARRTAAVLKDPVLFGKEYVPRIPEPNVAEIKALYIAESMARANLEAAWPKRMYCSELPP